MLICAWMICKWWMTVSAIENSCITKYVYWILNKIINQSINQSISDVRINNIKYAMIAQLQNPSQGFEDVIKAHFYLKKDRLLSVCRPNISFRASPLKIEGFPPPPLQILFHLTSSISILITIEMNCKVTFTALYHNFDPSDLAFIL